MSLIATTELGNIYSIRQDTNTITEQTLPSPAIARVPFTRPAFCTYNQRSYLNGQYSKNLVWTEFNSLRLAGIADNPEEPAVALGSSTGITAAQIRYVVTYAEIVGSVVVHESDVSDPTSALNASNQSIELTELQTSHSNSRVTHKRIYRSDNGGLYRFVANVAIATSTYTDTTPTLSLGAVAPENHGVPPYTKYNEVYHDRVWYAGDPDNPQRLYYSELGIGEAVGAASYIDTRDGEPIVSIKRVGDELIVFCPQAAYSVQGFTAADFVMRKISPAVGCLSHHAVVNINEILWFPSEAGVYSYNGSFNYESEAMRDYWRDDYKTYPLLYQDSVAVDDRAFRGYRLLIPKDSGFTYFLDYSSKDRGEAPYWMIDTTTRKNVALVRWSPPGAFRADIYTGSSDGYLRKDDPTNADDDSDSGDKTLSIQHGAALIGRPGGGALDGKTFKGIYSYVQAENDSWNFYALGGDEDVVSVGTPDNSSIFWRDARSASASAGKSAQSVHLHKLEKVSGRALQVRISCANPLGFRYRGFGGIVGPGPATRPSLA